FPLVTWKVAAECPPVTPWIEAGDEHDCWTTATLRSSRGVNSDAGSGFADIRGATARRALFRVSLPPNSIWSLAGAPLDQAVKTSGAAPQCGDSRRGRPRGARASR